MDFSETEQSMHEPSPQELQPGGMSVVGFLEKGQSLEQVRGRDKRALEIMGYTPQEVADLLAPVTEKAFNGRDFEYTAPNGKQFVVRVDVWRGMQECPWRDQFDMRKSNGGIDMYFSEKGKAGEVRIPGLMRHLIEGHSFFEGGAYRVPPERIISIFGTERVPGSLEQASQLKI